MAVVEIINKNSSKDSKIMCLVRRLVVACLVHNIMFRSVHIKGVLNILPDLLSRLQVEKFRQLAPNMDPYSTEIPRQYLHL